MPEPRGSYQPPVSPKERRAFFDLIRQIAEINVNIAALQETQLTLGDQIEAHQTDLDDMAALIADHETRIVALEPP